MSDNFGKGGFGLDSMEWEIAQTAVTNNTTNNVTARSESEIEREKNIEKYYKEHPEAILPSGNYGGTSHIGENGSITMVRTLRRR